MKSGPHNTYPELSFASVILHRTVALNDRAVIIISLGNHSPVALG